MIRALCLALCLPAAAGAGHVRDCGDWALLDAIPEPWEANSAAYANGAVRVTVLDLIEPASAPFMIAILSPPRDEIGGRQCRLVTQAEDMGFGDVRFADRRADYHPDRGLVLTVPVRDPSAEPRGDDEDWYELSMTIDQRTGEIGLQAFK